MKRLLALFIFIIILLLPFAETSLGKKDVYYQAGDYFEYADRGFLAVPNRREVELVEITGEDKLNKYQEFQTVGEPNNIMVKSNVGNLTAITVEGGIIASYDLRDLNNIKVIKKLGPYWQFGDFYYDIAPYMENKFLTAGKKGISIWNMEDLRYIEKVYDNASYGVAGYNYSIYAMTMDGALMINAEREKLIDNYIKPGEHLHKVYVDDEGRGFFPGDDVLKLRTMLNYKNLAHPSGAGNAVSGFSEDKYIYFVNGWNIYKLDKDFTVVSKVNTSLENGNWSAGVLAVEASQGRRIVVFNGNNILLFNEELKLLDKYSYMSYSKDGLKEKTMRVNPRHGSPGISVIVNGNGFWSGEEVSLSFADEKYIVRANNKGEAFKMVKAPDILPCKASILMKGANSGVEHNFWFEVD